MVIDKLMKKGLYKYLLPCIEAINERDYREEEALKLKMSMLVGLIIMLFMVPIGLVVSIPVVFYQAYKIVYAFAIRFLCCCFC